MRQSNLHSKKIVQAIIPETLLDGLSGDVTTGETVDTQGYESATFEIQLGAIIGAGTTVDITFEESDDDSNWNLIDIVSDPADLLAPEGQALAVAAKVIASSGESIKRGYIGIKRFIRMVVTATTEASTGRFPMSGSVVLGHARVAPPKNQL